MRNLDHTEQAKTEPRPRVRRRRGRFSSLTWRILAINLLALVIVVAGML